MYSREHDPFDDKYIRYVLETYSDTVIRLCYTYVRNTHDAEDIAEDVFCELIRSRPKLESAEHVKAWLLRVAVNKCKNHLKSARVRLSVPLEDDESGDTIPPPGEGGDVREALMELPEKYRTVIHLYYYEGLSIQEIARVTKTNAATVGTRMARGRSLLKKKLEVR
ncbi:MAG: sigma-70 family RNA polymerase sigma factor [Oscillospiraceae bacterium]|nr:sigma-70 family RNA polymerase sigma factor [Oscillospiraceae bacterium]